MPRILASLLLVAMPIAMTATTPAAAQTAPLVRTIAALPADDMVVQARDAWRKHDAQKLLQLRDALIAANHPLAVWADYWELNGRLNLAMQDELQAFYTRYPGTYLEDRLRNDWMLELGRRGDWKTLQSEYSRFRMRDDREVNCYVLLAEAAEGADVRERALAAWMAQREADRGCDQLASAMVDARRFTATDLWNKLRTTVEANRRASARQAAAQVSAKVGSAVGHIIDNPSGFLTRKATSDTRTDSELAALALVRMAANDPDAAAAQLLDRWSRRLPKDLVAWSWASIGKQAALRLSLDAPTYFQQSETVTPDAGELPLPEDALAWKVRAALRGNNGAGRWQQVVQAVNAMPEQEQADPAWIYWKGRALQSLSKDSQDPSALQAQATELFEKIAGQFHFYGKLASEELGRPVLIPPVPEPLTEAEQEAAAANGGLSRALRLIAIGLRGEGVREWNYSLRDLSDDRQLMAAAQLACDLQVWDRCINTSDRTRTEVNLRQRFPTPFLREVTARSREIGLDPAYVYGLIRQESRFIMDARSGVGASGLMQIMPATASWVAKKIGTPYSPSMLSDMNMNIMLGTSYLKLVLEDFEGSQAMAAAAYNAGPGRPRRWREGPVVDSAAWAENIPFPETRDYVKKVLSNSTYYGALLSTDPVSLKARLGRSIGPRTTPPPAFEKDIP